ncbi:hypothetical protein CAPTEDRAFT_226809 [Capitella teleta]|uniref:DNA polymerase theta n=1 Tax=Capitella teleta TaxID=283909 RepID=R7TYW9_CAPTE|nr:hypothetical protein CAPTEDRAFT_226809 [Capitella teleta]|eukprot:ELT96621.1 hypothetical protein CAPTEDRAFT_226809 [Capitella teleta]
MVHRITAVSPALSSKIADVQNRMSDGGNLVYSAPTSAGKTMVAELLMLKRFLRTKRKAIFILPFVSVVREKVHYLQDMFQDAGVRVDGFMGGQNPAGGLKMVDIAVCTIEKANSLINRLMEEREMAQLGCLVVDELHMVGDAQRGYLLELLLTKVRFLSQQAAEVQLIGMSATLPNLALLAKWLSADLYSTNFRPVPLTEMIKIGSSICDSSLAVVRELSPVQGLSGDEDQVISLCLETIQQGAIPIDLDAVKVEDVLEQLKRSPVGVDHVLGRTVAMGVAYHHAGLTFDERDIIEGGFRRGALRVLVATSTLSSGVNLPARRVIIRTPTFHGDVIETLTYKQMSGRAGRTGVDTAGESILVCKPSEKARAMKLVTSELTPVNSCLASRGSLSGSMKRAILEVVVSGVAATSESVRRYAQCTLLAASMEEGDEDDSIEECIAFLLQSEFISTQGDSTDGLLYHATPLGSAVLSSSLAPDEGLAVFAELQKARRCFVLENDLHLVYIVTPIYMCNSLGNIDWYQYLRMWEALSPGFRSVSDLVGVKESFLSRAVQGRLPTKTSEQIRTLQIHKRFYTALALHDLVNEVPLIEVAAEYKCTKGTLQSLQQAAATFAGMITVFCQRLGWHHLAVLLEDFQSRLTFGVQRELVDLVRVSLLTGVRARTLFDSGLQTVAQLANAEPRQVQRLLAKATPFQSKKKFEGDTEWEAQERRRKGVCGILGAGGEALTDAEAAQVVIAEAQRLMRADLALLGVQWKGQKSPRSTQGETSKGSSEKKRRSSEKKMRSSEKKRRSSKKKRRSSEKKMRSSEKKRRSTGKKVSTVTGKTAPPPTSPPPSPPLPPSPSPPPESEVLFSELSDSKQNFPSAEFTGGSSLLEAEASHLLAQLTPGQWQPDLKVSGSATEVSGSATEVSGSATEVSGSPALFMDETSDFMREFSTQQALIANSASPVLKQTATNKGSLFPDDKNDSFSSSVMDQVFNCDISLGNSDVPQPSRETRMDDTNRIAFVPSGKRPSTSEVEGVSPPKQNNTSDCVPPTPPKEEFTPQKQLIGGATGTPTRVLRSAAKPVVMATQQSFTIIDVAANKDVFKQFVMEWRSQPQFSLSVACDLLTPNDPKGDHLVCRGVLIHGVAVSWENRDSYFVSLSGSDEDADPDDSMEAPPLDPRLSLRQRLSAVKLCLQSTGSKVTCFDAKSTLRFLSEGCGVSAKGSFMDPKVADWLLDQGAKVKNLHRLVKTFAPDEAHLLNGLGGGVGYGSMGLCPQNPGSGRMRACTESVLARKVMSPLRVLLEEAGLMTSFVEVEMPTVALLSRMELNGMGFSAEESHRQRCLMQDTLVLLEERAYRLAKRQFQLTSAADVAQVLFIELKLPPNGDATTPRPRAVRGRRPAFSTSKEVLERLRSLHPLPGVILEWRRLSSSLSKVVFPLQREAVRSERLCMLRIHGVCDTHTATGRPHGVHAQQLQDFRLQQPAAEVAGQLAAAVLALQLHESPTRQMHIQHHPAHGVVAKGNVPQTQHVLHVQLRLVGDVIAEGSDAAASCSPSTLRMRDAFIPFTGGLLLAADYSQLELRIIAHLSQDRKLIRVLNAGGDVFRILASEWKGMQVHDVTAAQRQQTKQICYGMIYGIGAKALADQLSVSEQEAAVFCESFKAKFKGMRAYLRDTVIRCREQGFVRTMTGRKRPLPAINGNNAYARAQAERQAVNTSVQGSAADLVKAAMLKADQALTALWPKSRLPHLHCQEPLAGGGGRRGASSFSPPPGAYFILQLHDELIYEVNAQHVSQVATVVKDAMETALTLDVKLPVKVKVGPSWGNMNDYQVD